MTETYVTYKLWDGCKAPNNLESGTRLVGQRVGSVSVDRDALRGHPRCDAIGHAAAHEDDELWCEHCDIELDDSWRFCPMCGARIKEGEA